ncbi:hypothetical protein C8J57DRAFT_729776 [Mycena rebaudengoi]|nr:hypothetical protein C8J57DRAFT_729776 [Mycena rebaudengoi]
MTPTSFIRRFSSKVHGVLTCFFYLAGQSSSMNCLDEPAKGGSLPAALPFFWRPLAFLRPQCLGSSGTASPPISLSTSVTIPFRALTSPAANSAIAIFYFQRTLRSGRRKLHRTSGLLCFEFASLRAASAVLLSNFCADSFSPKIS